MRKILLLLLILTVFGTFLLSACDSQGYNDTVPPTDDTAPGEETVPPEEPAKNSIYIVGDSLSCEYKGNNLEAFYPRVGFGSQLKNYTHEKLIVNNLALSGRSSKSFISENEYKTLKLLLREGNYLIIAFGHNDHNSEDPEKFTDASKDYTDPTSFGYSLYENYIKLAREKGAIPILCTPVVYCNGGSSDYSGAYVHNTETGDYPQAIRDLAAAYNVPVIDLTNITKARYEELGAEAYRYHSVKYGLLADDGVTVTPDLNGEIDGCHLNLYGASYVAYRLAEELKNIDGISKYILDGIEEPTADILERYHTVERLEKLDQLNK